MLKIIETTKDFLTYITPSNTSVSGFQPETERIPKKEWAGENTLPIPFLDIPANEQEKNTYLAQSGSSDLGENTLPFFFWIFRQTSKKKTLILLNQGVAPEGKTPCLSFFGYSGKRA
jgi:hypothetical protein